MKNIVLFKDLSKESESLLKQFVDSNPIGSLIVNEEYEIVSINNCLKSYFKNDIKDAENYFGNIFKCQFVANEESLCGTKRQCINCKLRNSLIEALKFKLVIRDLLFNREFMINGEKTLKSFNITIVPIEIKGENYLWLSLVDLTEFMKYKFEFEMNQVLDEDEYLQKKNKFHDDVMNSISKNCYTGGEVYLVLFELKNVKEFQEKFGLIWMNDYISSFQYFLNKRIDTSEFVCRYDNSQFLVFLPFKEKIELNNFLEDLYEYQYKNYIKENCVISRTIKIKVDLEDIKNIVDKDQLHVNYFKSITVLEKVDEYNELEVIFR